MRLNTVIGGVFINSNFYMGWNFPIVSYFVIVWVKVIFWDGSVSKLTFFFLAAEPIPRGAGQRGNARGLPGGGVQPLRGGCFHGVHPGLRGHGPVCPQIILKNLEHLLSTV